MEKAARDGGYDVTVPFIPGRMDATDERTDAESFDWLQPVSDGFRNYHNDDVGYNVPPEHIFLDRAALLSLTAPEWTALTGGLRVARPELRRLGSRRLHRSPGVLSNDFFKVLVSMDYRWEPRDDERD